MLAKITALKGSRGRLHGIHSTDKNKYGLRSVNMGHRVLFTCSRTTDTCTFNQTSTYAISMLWASPVVSCEGHLADKMALYSVQ